MKYVEIFEKCCKAGFKLSTFCAEVSQILNKIKEKSGDRGRYNNLTLASEAIVCYNCIII